MNDTQLRERFDQWAAPLRATPPPPVGVLRRRARRHRARLAAAAGSALALTGLLAGLIVWSQGPAGRGQGPARQAFPAVWGTNAYPVPPGQPYVFVNGSAGGQAELRDAATGAVLKMLRAAGQGEFTSVTATPDDRLFVLAENSAGGQISFAELRISPGGRSGSPAIALTPVLANVTLADGSTVYFMAVNAAGTRLVLNVAAPGGLSSTLTVYDLTTGAVIGSWAEPGASLSTAQFLGADEMVVAWPIAPTTGASGSTVETTELRLVNTASRFRRGTSLPADSRPDRLPGFAGTLSQDGSVGMNTIDGAIGITSRPAGKSADLLEYGALTGRLLWAVPLGPASALRGPDFCGVLWASPDGRDLLTQCGTRQLAITDGRATAVRLPWILPSEQGLGVTPFAW
jgi:hypothetical protein